MSWTVKATKPGLSAAYDCPTVRAALEQVRYFAHKDYRTVTITDPDGTSVSVERLEAMVSADDAGVPHPASPNPAPV